MSGLHARHARFACVSQTKKRKNSKFDKGKRIQN
tara:strand:+ start:477 stop:578 length:102 start_codon:yes stop_codon:yes gene_type:complete